MQLVWVSVTLHLSGNVPRATTKPTLSAISKDEWSTKEDTGKSMKNVSVAIVELW